MNTCPIQKTLKVTKKDGQIWVRVEFLNISEQSVYIPKENPHPFVTLNGQAVKYVGPMEKRKSLTIDDYEKVPPKEKTLRQFEISSLYEFTSGEHAYEMSIAGGYKNPIAGELCDAPRITTKFQYKR